MTQDNDPWGNNPKNSKGNDFQEILNQLKSSLFGESKKQGGGNSNHSNDSSHSKNDLSPKFLGGIVGLAVIAWLLSGFYIVDEGFNGVELRFGKHSETAMPGLAYHAPFPIGSVSKVDVSSVKTLTVGGLANDNEGQMLTSDENIVEVGLAVQYQIGDPEKYLFKVNDPDLVLRESFISSIREVVGASTVDYLLTDGRGEWAKNVQKTLVTTLNGFDVGLTVLRVELKEAKAPSEVQDAFDDAVKAREDAERYKLQAEAYQNQQVPLARGKAKLITEAAEGYKEQVVAEARGRASRFTNVLESYLLAPEVTRDRMYLQTMQSIYSQVGNIVIDTDGAPPMLYLPASTGQVTSTQTPPPIVTPPDVDGIGASLTDSPLILNSRLMQNNNTGRSNNSSTPKVKSSKSEKLTR